MPAARPLVRRDLRGAVTIWAFAVVPRRSGCAWSSETRALEDRTDVPSLLVGDGRRGRRAAPPALVVPRAATPVLMDLIAPGLVRGTDGFGSSTVLVPKQGYVTYLVRTDSPAQGQARPDLDEHRRGLEADLDARRGDRRHRPLFRADHPPDRILATVHRRQTRRCQPRPVRGRLHRRDDDDPRRVRRGGPGGVGRQVARLAQGRHQGHGHDPRDCLLQPVDRLRLGPPVAGHRRISCASATRRVLVGPPVFAGTQTWSVRVTDGGTGRATYVYSQPWQGGEKAVWMLTLTVEAS